MSLPPHVDELVERILDVRPDAVIVTQSGTPVAMPWAHRAKGIVQMWFGGNEGGNGLADVLFGDVNPVYTSPSVYSFVRHSQDAIGR